MTPKKPTKSKYGYPCIVCDKQVDMVSQCGHACFCQSCSQLGAFFQYKCPICKVQISKSSHKSEVGFLWNLYVDSSFVILSNMSRNTILKNCGIDLSTLNIRYVNMTHVPRQMMVQRNNYAITPNAPDTPNVSNT